MPLRLPAGFARCLGRAPVRSVLRNRLGSGCRDNPVAIRGKSSTGQSSLRLSLLTYRGTGAGQHLRRHPPRASTCAACTDPRADGPCRDPRMAGPSHCPGRHRRRRAVRLRRLHRSPSTTATCCLTRTRRCKRWSKRDEQRSSRSRHPCSASIPGRQQARLGQGSVGCQPRQVAVVFVLRRTVEGRAADQASRPRRVGGSTGQLPARWTAGGARRRFSAGPVRSGAVKTTGHSRRSGRGPCAQPDATRAPTLRTVHSPCLQWAAQVMCPPPSGSWKSAGS